MYLNMYTLSDPEMDGVYVWCQLLPNTPRAVYSGRSSSL